MKVVLTEEQLCEGVNRLARQIAAAYGSRPLRIIGVLTGSIILLADLIRRLEMPLEIGLVQARSYRGQATRPGELSVSLEMLPPIKGADVLVIDDIFDTGRTLQRLLEEIRQSEPASLKSAVLLRKAARAEVAIQPDFVAFDIPDEFVVGYGLDFNDGYRNLPYLAVLEPEDLAQAAAAAAARVAQRGPSA